MTQDPVDQEKRIRRISSPESSSDGLRQKQSEAMKAFNRKTGKCSLTTNLYIARLRKAKGKAK